MRTEKEKDILVGKAAILIAMLIIVSTAFAMWQSERKARNVVFVEFSEMGALQVEDVVSIRGLEVGKIASVKKKDGKALVELHLNNSRIFLKDTKFKNTSPNIMGSRAIVIEPGKHGDLAPSDYIFQGEFNPGLTELLALSSIAMEKVNEIAHFIRLLRYGDDKSPSLQEQIENITKECENLIEVLSVAVGAVEEQVVGALNKVSYYSEEVADASIKIDKTLDTMLVQAESGIVYAESIVLNVKKTIDNLNSLLTKFEENKVTIALLDNKQIVDDINSLLSTLQMFMNSIDTQGIKIYDENGKRKSMVNFINNVHLFRETARSKAKKRSMEELK